jgi:CheY-like chemotaxis protein/HPt (histidine-containing phosphotransfer) domain-containing protein
MQGVMEMSDSPNQDMDDIFQELRRDFIVTARQKLADLDSQLAIISAEATDDPDIIADMRREIHSLKGMGGTFGFPALTAVAHRLEDFIASVGSFAKYADDIVVFIDCLNDIIDIDPQPDNDELARIVRRLPAGKKTETEDPELPTIEVLLVVPNPVLRPLLQHHLEQAGCRVVGAKSPFSAIELSVRTQPELVISSVVLTGLDGIDLLRSLDSMTSTGSIKLALLTSMSLDDPVMSNLPESAFVISAGGEMGNDILNLIEQLRSDTAQR